jgi:heptosyltransferase-2
MADSVVQLPAGARLLLRLPNWLGDVILATPALGALRRARPDLRLAALVKPAAAPAVRGLAGLEEILLLEDASIPGTWRRSRDLRGMGFAGVLIFPKGFREAALAWMAGIPVRVGLDTDHRARLLTHPVSFTRRDWHEHHARQFAKVLEPLEIELGEEGLAFPLSDSGREEADRLMAEHALERGRFAVFHVGASKAPRAWHAARFGEVARRLEGAACLRPVLVGTHADALFHREFLSACPSAVNLEGQTSLGGMAALVSKTALFVGNDSGPMHVAAAVGARVVAVFGPGAPHKTAPYLPPESLRVVYAELPCSPCRQAFWKECRPCPSGKPPCLEGIHPDAVLGACLELIKVGSEAVRK